jgi:hypothetical protein
MEVSNIKFDGNPSSGSRADTCVQTDGHEHNGRLLGLRERAFNWHFSTFVLLTENSAVKYLSIHVVEFRSLVRYGVAAFGMWFPTFRMTVMASWRVKQSSNQRNVPGYGAHKFQLSLCVKSTLDPSVLSFCVILRHIQVTHTELDTATEVTRNRSLCRVAPLSITMAVDYRHCYREWSL